MSSGLYLSPVSVFKSSIHPFSIPLILQRVAGVLKPIPAEKTHAGTVENTQTPYRRVQSNTEPSFLKRFANAFERIL